MTKRQRRTPSTHSSGPIQVGTLQRAVACLLFGTLSALGCGGGGGDGNLPTTPTPPSPTALALNVSALTLRGIGASDSLRATISPSGATGTIVWSSDAPAVASVIGTGAGARITAVGGGTTILRARLGSLEASATITVLPTVQRIALDTSTLVLALGDSAPLAPTVTADAGADATIAFTSSAPAIVSVRADGTVVGVSPGESIITARATAFPEISASRRVRVQAAVVTVAIAAAPDTIVIGASARLTVTVTPPAPNPGGIDLSVNWTSRAPAIASIDSSGQVSALTAGSVTLVAISRANPAIGDSVVVAVRAPRITSFTISPTSLELPVGDTLTLQPTLTAEPGANSRITWSSDARAVVSVDSTGRLTAVAAGGPVTVRARPVSNPSLERTITVRVVAAPPPGFVPVFIGKSPYAGRYGVRTLLSLDANSLLFATVYQTSAFLWQTDLTYGTIGALADVPEGCCGQAGSIDNGAALSPQDVLLSRSGPVIANPAVAPTVIRRLNGTWRDTGWPAGTPGQFLAAQQLVAVGDHYLAASRANVFRLNGTWQPIARVTTGLSDTPNVHGMVAWGNDNVVLSGCAGTSVRAPWIAIRQADSLVPLAAPTGPCTGSSREFPLVGSDSSNLATVSDRGLHVRVGGAWQLRSSGLAVADTLTNLTRCGQVVYAASQRTGAIYRLDGTTLTRIANNADAAATTSLVVWGAIDCAPDGTLRYGSGDGHVARLSGSTWVRENWAPSLTDVALDGEQRAWATSAGALHRWNGTSWSTPYHQVFQRFRPLAVIARAGGEAFGIARVSPLQLTGSGSPFATSFASFSYASGALTLHEMPNDPRFDEVSLAEVEGGTVFASLSGIGATQVFRWDGATWSTLLSLSTTRTALAARSATDVIVVGRDIARRFDGTTWQAIPSFTPPGGGGITTAHLTSDGTAWVGNCEGQTTRYGAWRLVGSSWQNISPPVPNATCLADIESRSPTDVFALVVTGTPGDRTVLMRWNGVEWSRVPLQGAGNVALTSLDIEGDRIMAAGSYGRVFTALVPQLAPRILRR